MGCATAGHDEAGARRFDFDRDTFAYINDLYWHYDFGIGSESAVTRYRAGPVEYGQRCIVMTRAARQFFYAARFAPDAGALSEAEYRERVRAVLDSDPRTGGSAASPVLIPGYPDLRSFSRQHEGLLKQELGGRIASYVQRGNWRMVFPFSRGDQRTTAGELLDDLARGRPPIVHLVNFPVIDINHALLIFDANADPSEIHFRAYDPNDAGRPVLLVFDRATSTFRFPRTEYFSGGPVNVYEIYAGVFF